MKSQLMRMRIMTKSRSRSRSSTTGKKKMTKKALNRISIMMTRTKLTRITAIRIQCKRFALRMSRQAMKRQLSSKSSLNRRRRVAALMATNNSKSLHYPTDLRSVGISERATLADLKPPSTTLMIFKLSLKLKIAEIKSETTKGQPKKKTSTICRIIWRVMRRGRTSRRKMIKRVRNSAKKVNIPLKMAQSIMVNGKAE